LIENAVKHGIGRSNRGGNISLSATIEDHHLTVTVTDSGAGIAPPMLPNILSQGVGLANVNDRLVALYGQEAALRIYSTPGRGTIVSFEIPLTVMKGHASLSS